MLFGNQPSKLRLNRVMVVCQDCQDRFLVYRNRSLRVAVEVEKIVNDFIVIWRQQAPSHCQPSTLLCTQVNFDKKAAQSLREQSKVNRGVYVILKSEYASLSGYRNPIDVTQSDPLGSAD